jgi:hypothetical protein
MVVVTYPFGENCEECCECCELEVVASCLNHDGASCSSSACKPTISLSPSDIGGRSSVQANTAYDPPICYATGTTVTLTAPSSYICGGSFYSFRSWSVFRFCGNEILNVIETTSTSVGYEVPECDGEPCHIIAIVNYRRGTPPIDTFLFNLNVKQGNAANPPFLLQCGYSGGGPPVASGQYRTIFTPADANGKNSGIIQTGVAHIGEHYGTYPITVQLPASMQTNTPTSVEYLFRQVDLGDVCIPSRTFTVPVDAGSPADCMYQTVEEDACSPCS